MLALFMVAVASAVSVGEVPNPRQEGSWVTDMADVLDAGAEGRIDATIEDLHRQLGVEIAVVTVDEVPGTPKSFATELFNFWGIGNAEIDDGLLVLLVMDARRLEMETGIGLEPVLPDGWLADMQQRAMVPYFKQGDFAGGIEAGLDEVGRKLRVGPVEAAVQTPLSGPAPGRPFSPLAGMGVGGALGASLVGTAGALWLRRRRRRCPQCDIPMLALDDVAEDAYLDEGQEAEEALGSVDWEVLICPSCQFSREIPHRRWFSGYRKCPSCGNRTATRTSVTLLAATYDHGGEVRVTEDCHHCPHHHSWVRSTPKRTRPSSSSASRSRFGSSRSSGGGRSFGGGRSRGGGAGSSW